MHGSAAAAHSEAEAAAEAVAETARKSQEAQATEEVRSHGQVMNQTPREFASAVGGAVASKAAGATRTAHKREKAE